MSTISQYLHTQYRYKKNLIKNLNFSRTFYHLGKTRQFFNIQGLPIIFLRLYLFIDSTISWVKK